MCDPRREYRSRKRSPADPNVSFSPQGGTRPTLEKDVNLEEIAHDIRCDCFT